MKILVLLGTNPYSFTRLVKLVDDKLGSLHEVHIQLGNTKYLPTSCSSFTFKERSEILYLINSSDLIISQGGYGSIMDVLLSNKPLLVLPRERDLHECLDDQHEITDYFAKRNFLKKIDTTIDIVALVSDISQGKIKLSNYQKIGAPAVKNLIKSFVNELEP